MPTIHPDSDIPDSQRSMSVKEFYGMLVADNEEDGGTGAPSKLTCFKENGNVTIFWTNTVYKFTSQEFNELKQLATGTKFVFGRQESQLAAKEHVLKEARQLVAKVLAEAKSGLSIDDVCLALIAGNDENILDLFSVDSRVVKNVLSTTQVLWDSYTGNADVANPQPGYDYIYAVQAHGDFPQPKFVFASKVEYDTASRTFDVVAVDMAGARKFAAAVNHNE